MPEIAEWIKKIIALLILAGFLEMILPNNELKGVTKLVMGLLVLLVITQPMLKILKIPQDVLGTLPAITDTKNNNQNFVSTQKILTDGLMIRGFWTKELRQRTQTIVQEKIRGSIGLIDGIQVVDFRTDFKDVDKAGIVGLTGITGLGGIHLRVIMTQATKHSLTLKEIIIKRKQYEQRIRESIQIIGNIPDKRIEVTWDD